MTRRTNIINNVISMLLMLGGLFAVVYFCDLNYKPQLIITIVWVVVGAIVAGFINAVVHELGHLLAGKRNGFAFSSMAIWFFKWTKEGEGVKFSLTIPINQAGYTEMIPTHTDNMAKRYSKMTAGGFIGSFICMILGILPFIFNAMSVELFCVLGMFLPLGAYYFFGNALPMTSNKVRNDGAVVCGLRKMDDVAKVTVNLLTAQAQIYQGRTPAEVDEDLYFDLPQLAEDQPEFAMLLNARYNYYLDLNDIKNAQATIDRLLSLEDYLPKDLLTVVKADALYNACMFDGSEDTVDDYMYELEKYLNKVNTLTNLRIKLAYSMFIKDEDLDVEEFYTACINEADKAKIKGYGKFEKKLLKQVKETL